MKGKRKEEERKKKAATTWQGINIDQLLKPCGAAFKDETSFHQDEAAR